MINKNKEKNKILDGLEEFFRKDRVNILVTDSGLGGVSVAADVYERLKNSGIFTHGNVIFFNAQAHPEYVYNKMATNEQKIAVFDESLKKMEEKFKPDILLIACNTLSVLYAKTRHAKATKYPVIGIVETGVNLIKQSLKEEPNSDIFIFGTETTIDQGTYKKMLTKLGVAADKIYTQAFPGLADAIDNSPRGKETTRLVHKYVLDALEGYQRNRKSIIVSLNCTHFGYSDNLIPAEFSNSKKSHVFCQINSFAVKMKYMESMAKIFK